MTITTITILGLAVALGAWGAFYAWLFRRESRKALNIGLLTLGVILLVYGHLLWSARRESEEVKEAMFIAT